MSSAQPAATLGRGVWQILPTPFRGREAEVDHGSLRRVVEHARGCGVAGVVALGVLGEADRLSARERHEVLATVIAAAGQLPVVAGIPAMATAPAMEQASEAAELGARAIMARVPCPAGARVAVHCEAIRDAAGVGIVLQDHPASSGVVIDTVQLVIAVQRADGVLAVKAESPPTPQTIAALHDAVPAVPTFGGLGGVGLLDELCAGAAGAMTGFAVPEALVAAVAAFADGGYPAARDRLAPYLPLIVCESQVPVGLALRKEVLRRRGLIDEAAVRMPGASLPDWAARAIDVHLDALAQEGRMPGPAAAVAA